MERERLFVLTGASRGLGRGIAEQILTGGGTLLALSRKPDTSLDAVASRTGARLEQWAVDVSQAAVADRLEHWLADSDAKRWASATLINNAGVIGAVGSIEAAIPESLVAALRINLEGPLLLTRAFLRATRTWAIDKRVLNISSGAGHRAVAGWAAYCATKAGLDHFSRVVALDEALLPNPARIVSLAPGVIDTDMQSALRAADAASFPEHHVFVELKAGGQLPSPAAAAQRVLAYLARADFGATPVADVRDS